MIFLVYIVENDGDTSLEEAASSNGATIAGDATTTATTAVPTTTTTTATSTPREGTTRESSDEPVESTETKNVKNANADEFNIESLLDDLDKPGVQYTLGGKPSENDLVSSGNSDNTDGHKFPLMQQGSHRKGMSSSYNTYILFSLFYILLSSFI